MTSDSGSMLARLQIISPRQVTQDLAGTSSEDCCRYRSPGSCPVTVVSKGLRDDLAENTQCCSSFPGGLEKCKVIANLNETDVQEMVNAAAST